MQGVQQNYLQSKIKTSVDFIDLIERDKIYKHVLRCRMKKSDFNNTKPFAENIKFNWSTDFLKNFQKNEADFLFEKGKEIYGDLFSNPKKFFSDPEKKKETTLENGVPFFCKKVESVKLGDNNSRIFKETSYKEEEKMPKNIKNTNFGYKKIDLGNSPIFSNKKNFFENHKKINGDVIQQMLLCVMRSRLLLSNFFTFFKQNISTIVNFVLRMKLKNYSQDKAAVELIKLENLLNSFQKIYSRQQGKMKEKSVKFISEINSRLQSVESILSKKPSTSMNSIKKIGKLRKLNKSKTTKVNDSSSIPQLKSTKSTKSRKSKGSLKESNNKKIPTKSKNILKKKKPKKFDKFENFLIGYNSLMAQSLVKSGDWIEEIFYSENFKNWIQMFVELVPCINNNKEIIKSQPGFVKGIFEVAYNLIKNRDRVFFDEAQTWIGIPDLLPLSFKPESKFWLNFSNKIKKNEKKKLRMNKKKVLDEKNSDSGKNGKLPPVVVTRKNGVSNLGGVTYQVKVNDTQKSMKEVELLADKEISKKLQDTLISLTSFLRGYLKRLCDEFNFFQVEVQKGNAIKKFGLKSKEVSSIVRSYSRNLKLRKEVCEIYVLCFLLVSKITDISFKEKRGFMIEIDEVLGMNYWRDSPKILESIRNWYKKIFFEKGSKVKKNLIINNNN